MWRPILCLVPFFCYSASFGAPASTLAELKQSIAKCSQLTGDLARLDCFDRVSKDNHLITSTQAVPISGKGKWDVNVEINPLDDSKTVSLSLKADSGAGSFGSSIFLLLRCKSNKTELFISWSDYLGSEAYVTSRIGTQDATTTQWSLSTDSQATFYPGNDIDYIKALIEADKYVAQVTPYNESPTTAVFDVRGLENAIKPLRETCGW